MKRSIILLLVLMLLGSIVFICCKDSIEDELPKLEPEPTPVISIPLVGAIEVTEVTTASISYRVSIKEDGGASITGRGVCYSTNDNPTILDNKTSDGKGTESFSGRISELSPDMVYYVRAYATNSEGTSYGESVGVTLIKLESLIGAEEAFPGVVGELVTVTYDIGGEITCRKIDGRLFYQGDIVIPTLPETRGVGRNPNTSTRLFGALWPDNTLYYSVDQSFPDKNRIQNAINLFSETEIVFKEIKEEEKNEVENYVQFIFKHDSLGCWSYIGMIGGEQYIHIANWGTSGVIAHELCHALGLAHEHSKPSAYKYINIHKENIDTLETKMNNFSPVSISLFHETLGFDFESIMLYSSDAFGKKEEFRIGPYHITYKRKTTISKKDGGIFKAQRERLSVDDIKIINQIYNRSPSAPQLISPKDNATISDLPNFTWEASTDPDNDPLVYDLYLTPRTNYGIPPQYFNQVNWEWRFENILSTKYEFNQSFLPYGTYYWAVVAREDKPDKAKASHSSIYTFTLALFNAPMLTYPADRSIFNKNKTAEINIHWESVTGADEYWLNVFPEGKSSSPIFGGSIGIATNKKINISREENGIYVIQVKARKTGGEWSKFSDSHKIIIDTPPAAPAITAPKNNISITRNTSQTFSWNKPSTGIDRYYLRIVKGTNLNATPIYEPNEFKENSKSINCNWEPGTYTWSVRAMKETPEGFSDSDYKTIISWGNYAESRTFVITEPVSAPTVTTFPATNITSTSAILNGEVTSDGGAPITQRGFYWCEKCEDPGAGDSIALIEGTTGNFSYQLTNLKPQTSYTFTAFVTNKQGTETGNVFYVVTDAESQLGKPQLTAPDDLAIFNKTKTEIVNIVWDNVAGAGEYWLNVFPEGQSATPIFDGPVGNATNKTLTINTRENGIYVFQIRARKTGGEWSEYSDSRKFIADTPPAAPVITAPKNNISIVRNISQTFSWNMPSTGIDRYYLRIVNGTDFNATPVYEKELSESSQNVNCNWAPGVYTWSVRAMKETPEGYSKTGYETIINWGNYAQSRTFVITEPVSVPTVTTSAVTSITETTATSGGNITSDGGLPVTARGVCWSTTTNPTVDSYKTTDGSGTGSFSSSLTGLTAGITYYVRAYATNSAGTAYGEEKTFKTQDDGVLTGTFTDTRDGKTYKTVKIGEQVWMAENLAYLPKVNVPDGKSRYEDTVPVFYVYDYHGTDVVEAKSNYNYITYGVLYNYVAALEACPEGWHLPAGGEWEQLAQFISDTKGPYASTYISFENIGGHLKATSEWIYHRTGGGTDDFGFSALPGAQYGPGYVKDKMVFGGIGDSGYWWSTTKSWNMYFFYKTLQGTSLDKGAAQSIRCVRN